MPHQALPLDTENHQAQPLDAESLSNLQSMKTEYSRPLHCPGIHCTLPVRLGSEVLKTGPRFTHPSELGRGSLPSLAVLL